jgi:hypothetical protein
LIIQKPDKIFWNLNAHCILPTRTKFIVFLQVGIVSFGPAPCDGNIPAVYTRVAAYKDWIVETIEANGGY